METPILLFFFFFFFFSVFSHGLVLGQRQRLRLSSAEELAALYSLRGTLGLRAKNWPRRTDPCANWTGVSCQSGRVVGIDLTGLRRTRVGRANPRFAVDGLRKLTRLSSFNSTGFALPGQIPDWFGSELSVFLSVLDLRRSSISGNIPASLGSLVGLRVLCLSGNSLVGSVPSSLGKLGNLTSLDLSSNCLSISVPETFGNLVNLTHLDLSSNSLGGLIPPALGSLRILRSLSLSGNSFTGALPESFKNMSGLQVLNLGNNSLAGILPENVIASLPRLTSIVLSNNNFSGALPDSLWTLSGLRFVDFSYNNFSGELPVAAVSLISASEAVFNLSHNSFHGHLPSGAGKLIQVLNFLDISYNYFEGGMPFGRSTKASVEQNCFSNATGQRSSMDCSAFYASYKGLTTYDGPGSPNSGALPPVRSSSRKGSKYLIYIIIVAVVVVFILLALVVFICLRFFRKRGSVSAENDSSGVVPGGGIPPRVANVSLSAAASGDSYTYDQLLKATSSFNVTRLIKNGRSGDLYHGNLEGGAPVVVKKIDMSSPARDLYLVELAFFARASHTRLVPYLGHCSENGNEKLLVYKYMPNGDLVTAFYRKSGEEKGGMESLDWITRQKIAIGVAEALFYLHHECAPPIVHRDVQASSILLDDKFEVRLGSLSEACNQEGDGHQRVITRFLRSSHSSGPSSTGSTPATCAYDIYCFGKVLLELVTGRLGISGSDYTTAGEMMERILPHISIHEKELLTDMLDPTLIVDEDLLDEVWAMAIVAKSCLNPKPSSRPQIKHILKALENPLKVTREEAGSARLRATSSRGSWNMALFGSWRSSSEVIVAPAPVPVPPKETSGLKRSGTTGSQGSGGDQ